MEPDGLKSKLKQHDDDKVIENEYGDLFTLEEFNKMLIECPVQFRESVGEWFA